MSYCRHSSDDWACDLYCYEDVGGFWATHVASNRIVGDIPKVNWDLLDKEDDSDYGDRWYETYRTQMDYIKTAKREKIGLAHDGATFSDPTLKDFLNRLVMLREVGYNFPDSVLEWVREELKEGGEDI